MTGPTRPERIMTALPSLTLAVLLACPLGAAAQEAFVPTAAFLQAGASQGTQSFTAGLAWDLPYAWTLGTARIESRLEASYAWWQIRSGDRDGISHLSQLALIPALRYRSAHGSPWFFEAGLGVTVTSSVYRTRRRRFSTAFNFGTHLAVGRSFGAQRQHEVSLRFEHFSNAGIRHPNPGANFVQLRYERRF